jgi:hypothetical protein
VLDDEVVDTAIGCAAVDDFFNGHTDFSLRTTELIFREVVVWTVEKCH